MNHRGSTESEAQKREKIKEDLMFFSRCDPVSLFRSVIRCLQMKLRFPGCYSHTLLPFGLFWCLYTCCSYISEMFVERLCFPLSCLGCIWKRTGLFGCVCDEIEVSDENPFSKAWEILFFFYLFFTRCFGKFVLHLSLYSSSSLFCTP